MIVTAWNNGENKPNGNGYGVRIKPHDRDTYIRREWGTVQVELEGESSPAIINIDKDSFWGPDCRELICVRIGKWLIKNKLAPWPKGDPPKLTLTHVGSNQFRLSRS